MRAKITYFVTAAVLVVYFVLVGSRGVLLIQQRHAAHRRLRRRGADPAGHRRLVPLAEHAVRPQGRTGSPRELEAEGGLPVDELDGAPRRPYRPRLGRRGLRPPQAETEDSPDDWRCWFRLAVAYHDARDTPRARKAMQRAIALHDGAPARSAPEAASPVTPEARTSAAAGSRTGVRALDAGVRRRCRQARPGTPRPSLDRVRRPVERLGRATGNRRCGRSSAPAAPRRRARPASGPGPGPSAAAPASAPAAGPYGPRRSAPTATVRVEKKRHPAQPRGADPDAHPQQPQRATPITQARRPGRRRRRRSVPANAMIIAASEHERGEQQQQRGRAHPPGPRPVRAPPAVGVVEGQRDVLRPLSRQTRGRPSEKGRGTLYPHSHARSLGCAR